MSKRVDLVSALKNASGKTQSKNISPDSKPSLIKESPPGTPPSRQGKKAITGFFDPVVSRQLKQLALNEDRTIQLLLAEALNDLFEKYNQKPIA